MVLALDIVRSGRFVFGQGGFSLECDDSVGSAALRSAMERHGAERCLRYPGLEQSAYGGPGLGLLAWDVAAGDLVPRARRADWLTCLPGRAIELLGGSALLPPVRAYPLAQGVLLRADDEPSLSATPGYRAVAKAISPDSDPGDRGASGLREDWCDEWLEALG